MLKRGPVAPESAIMAASESYRPVPPALSEWEIYADHREALLATLFEPHTPDVVLELREGRLAARAERRG